MESQEPVLAGTLVYQPGSRARGIWWVRAWVQDWWTQLGLGAADDRVIPRTFQDVQVIAISPVWLIACSAKCPGLAFPFRVVVQLALSG
jgi:hypothetical protein